MVEWIFSYQLWGLHIVDGLPCIVALWVSLPLNQVLEFAPMMSVASYHLNLILFFTFNHVRWWPHEVLAMFIHFDVRCKEGGVENGVYVPLRRESQLIYHW